MMYRGGGDSEDERPSSTIRGPRDPRTSTRRSATTPLPGEATPTSYRRSDQPPSSYPQRPSSQNTTRRSLPETPQRSHSVPVGQHQQGTYDSDDSDDIYVNDDEPRQSNSADGPSFPNPQHYPHEQNRLHIPMPMPTPSTSAPAFPTPHVQGSGPLNIAMPRPVSFATDSELNEYQDANSQFSDSAVGSAEPTSGQIKHSFPSPWETNDHKLESDQHRQSPPPSSFPEPRIGRRNDSLGQPSSPGRPSGPRNSLDHQSGPKPIVIRPMPSPPPSFPNAGTTSSAPRRPSFGTSGNHNRHLDLEGDDDKPEVEEPQEMPVPTSTMPVPASPPRYGPVRPAGRVHTMPKPGEPPRRSSTDRARRPSIEAGPQNIHMPSAQNMNMPMPAGSSSNAGPTKTLPVHLPPQPPMPTATSHSYGIARPPSSTGHGKPHGPPTFPSSSNSSDPKPITNVLPPSSAQIVQNHNQYVDSLQNSHPRPSGSVSSHSQHQHAPTRPSGSSSTGHGHNYPPSGPARPGTVHTISSTAHSQATTSPPASRPPTTFAPSTTSTVAPTAHTSKPPASSTSASTVSKPPTRPTADHTNHTSQHAPSPIRPSNSNNGKPLPSTSKPPPAPAPVHHAPTHTPINHNSSNNNSNNAHHPAPTASHNDSPQMPSRPHLFGGTSQLDTQYVNMLLALDDIPYWYNLAASFFTWILLAGFILFPGTFTNLQTAAASNNLPVNSPFVVDAVNGITKLPLYIVAWVCTGMGIMGMIWLTWRWRKNYLWALNKIFVPGLLNSLAGLVSTLASIFGAQNGELSTTSRITVIVLAVSSGIFLLLVAIYSLWFIRRIKAKHDKQVGKERAGKYGEGVVDHSKRKNR